MMTDIAEMNMCLKSASNLLAVEALRTFPIDPYQGKFKFLVNGIKKPEWTSDDKERQRNNEKYISECLELKVIPFSTTIMEYADDKKLFGPKPSLYNPLIPIKSESVLALLDGGKVHEVSIETSGNNNDFNIFRQNFLQTLTDKGYVLDNIALCIKTKYHEPDSTLNFNLDNKHRGLILHLGSNISEDDTNRLEAWFKKLRTYQD